MLPKSFFLLWKGFGEKEPLAKSLKNRKFLEFLAENQILGTLDAFTIFLRFFYDFPRETLAKSQKNQKFLEFLAENQILGTLDAFTIFFTIFLRFFYEFASKIKFSAEKALGKRKL